MPAQLTSIVALIPTDNEGMDTKHIWTKDEAREEFRESFPRMMTATREATRKQDLGSVANDLKNWLIVFGMKGEYDDIKELIRLSKKDDFARLKEEFIYFLEGIRDEICHKS